MIDRYTKVTTPCSPSTDNVQSNIKSDENTSAKAVRSGQTLNRAISNTVRVSMIKYGNNICTDDTNGNINGTRNAPSSENLISGNELYTTDMTIPKADINKNSINAPGSPITS
jgi:hypothetical protein